MKLPKDALVSLMKNNGGNYRGFPLCRNDMSIVQHNIRQHLDIAGQDFNLLFEGL